MPKNNVVVIYQNLHPSDDTRVFIDGIVNEIHHELPKGSKVRATFTAKDNIVKGILQAGSNGKPFFATAASTDMHDLAVRLLSQMRRRLEKFKSKHHRRLSMKDLGYHYEFFEDSAGMEAERAS